MKIAITGPESSGKTKLAIQLASHFSTVYTPEYARFWLQEHGPTYDLAAMDEMIRGQQLWEKRSALILSSPQSGGCEPLLYFTDSDATVFEVWMTVRFGCSSPLIDEWFDKSPAELTLLCHPDLNWSYDPLRENQLDRYRLFEQYKEVLNHRKVTYAEIKGLGNERVKCAIKAVHEIR